MERSELFLFGHMHIKMMVFTCLWIRRRKLDRLLTWDKNMQITKSWLSLLDIFEGSFSSLVFIQIVVKTQNAKVNLISFKTSLILTTMERSKCTDILNHVTLYVHGCWGHPRYMGCVRIKFLKYYVGTYIKTMWWVFCY